MTKENRGLLIQAFIALIIGVIMVVLYAVFMPTTSADKVFGKKVTLKNEVVLNQIPETASYEVIHKKVEAFQGSKKVGDIYTLAIKNGFGDIEVSVGIDGNQHIYVYANHVNQVHYIEAYGDLNARIIRQIQRDYQGVDKEAIYALPAENLKVGDASLETGASVSTATIYDLIVATLHLHFQDQSNVDDPLLDVFGEYTLEEDASGVLGVVVKKENILVGGVIAGYRYTFEKEASFDAGGSTKTGIIGLQIVYKLDGTIVSFATDKYTHTTTQRRPKINQFLQTFINTNVEDLLVTAQAGNASIIDIDATYSVNLVLDLINQFYTQEVGGAH